MGAKPRDLPAYGPAEAARYLNIPISTVRYWSIGQDHHRPLIKAAQVHPLALSFVNLVELHSLTAMRRKHRISLPKVRQALDFVRGRLRVSRPLVDRSFQTDGVELFVEQYGQLINASQEGQLAMKQVLAAAMVRVRWDDSGYPIRLFPYTRNGTDNTVDLIMIDPGISGGRAVITGTRIAVEVVAERYKVGESINELARDYGVKREGIEEAIRCELPIAA